jgi:hypothetical protein
MAMPEQRVISVYPSFIDADELRVVKNIGQ